MIMESSYRCSGPVPQSYLVEGWFLDVVVKVFCLKNP